VSEFGRDEDEDITKYPPIVEITALNLERFISFDIFYLRFIDSVRFLNASLDSLVQNLISSCEHQFNKFVHTRENIKSDCPETDNLIFGKGVFPYEYFDSLDKFKDISLPPKGAFYNLLKEEGISDDDYERAQRFWSKFDCQNFKDYHDFYSKTDVLLLADVFEQFRKTGMENFHLDPAMYLTLPSYSWDACLMMTDVKLELIREPENT